jgi:hypothetical protein
VTTLQGNSPEAEAFAVRGEKFLAVGSEAEVMRLAGDGTRLVDAGGRGVIPGLGDPLIRWGCHAAVVRLACCWTGCLCSLMRRSRPVRSLAVNFQLNGLALG